MTTVTNVSGTNAGPNQVTQPDVVQMPIGNTWKIGTFSLTLSPASVAATTTAEQTFVMTGLLTTDFVAVNKPTSQPGLGIVGSRVSAAGVLAINFETAGASVSPTASEVYTVFVARVLPNWTAPTSGSLLDW